MENSFNPTLRPLARTLPAIGAKFPMHVVQSRSHLTGGKETGLTISEEDANNGAANAEYEVLKAIISREQYLVRLQEAVRTVNKTFKPEVIDVIDLVRMASVDVVEKIVLWRESKGDPQASFIWNGLNYLLKMPSDLDYLADYMAIQRWAVFPLNRNPFCVPFALDPAAAGGPTGSVVDPKHVDKNSSITEGYSIGRPTDGTPKARIESMKAEKASPYAPAGKYRGSSSKSDRSAAMDSTKGSNDMQSFVFNEDMRRVRRAEAVILKAEELLGVFSKNADGRLIPITQALTSKASVELKKDDRRSITEPSHTTHNYAPHAIRGAIGLAESGWAPPMLSAQQQLDAVNERKTSKFLKERDDSVNPKQRGMAKSGGELQPADTKGSSTRPHKPIKPSISSKVDFSRYRQIMSLDGWLANIRQMKEELEAAKMSASTDSRDAQEASLQTIRSSLSNKLGTGGMVAPLRPKALTVDTKSFPENYLSSSKQPRRLDFDKVLGDTPAKDVRLYERSNPPSRDGSRKATPLLKSSSEAEIIKPAAQFDEAALKQLSIDEVAATRKLRKLTEEQEVISSLKKHEVDQKTQQRSREIERKRRLLTEEESRRVGPPTEDEPNVYDYYATKLQSAVRGWVVRRWVRWYREVSTKAAIVAQSVIRGWLGRLRVGNMRLYFNSATIIQKNFRGWLARGTSSTMAKRQNLMKNAVTIQRMWRGVLGKRRAMNKRDLDKAAKQAFDAVDAQSLVASDVKELAHRIIYAIEEPTTTSFPPDEVLYLLRQTVLIIQSARGYLGLADYDFFNARHYDEVGGDELDWKQAGKTVNRSETFIRLVRTLAFGPGAKPPRLIQLPNAVNALYSAQVNNPLWNIHTFEHMGKGSRICTQLFKWLTAMIEISDRQQQFLSLIASSFPDWLPKMNELQQAGRLCEFEIELNKKCIDLLNQHKLAREGDEEYLDILDKECKVVRRAGNDAKGRLRHTVTEIAKLKNDQSTRELVALTTLEQRLVESRTELDDLTKSLQDASNLADQGDRAAKELVQELRLKLTNMKLKTSELEGQRKLLELQVESNKAKRRADARLATNTVFRTTVAGEAKAAYVIAQVDAKYLLRSAGVKHASDLPSHLVDMYDPLAQREEQCRVEARARFLEAERERKSFEDYLGRSMVESDLKEQKSKSKMSPTEQELEEERLENEKEAVEERRKHMQYLPDAVLHNSPKRPRPVIIALARDLPGPAKKKICADIIASMPGTFIYLDTDINYGMDVEAIQAVITSHQCAIINVDHGLTRATRDSFLKALDLTLHALVPTPLIALAVGSDKNIRGGAHAPECGVDSHDLRLLRDSRLKVCMETLASLLLELQSVTIRKLAFARAAEVVPASQSLALVMEACFLFYSEEKTYDLPHSHRRPLTWPLTRKLLLEPNAITQKMMAARRGQANLALLNCLQQYFTHELWPSSHDEERSNDILLHSLASLLEQYVECELLCMKGGGAPPQAFTKSSVRGIQTVVVVCDQEQITSTPKVGRKDGVFGKEASSLLVKAALEDLRILKTVAKIGKEPCTISVYREHSNVFFEAYDSATSESFVTMVSAYDIPAMLVPNGTDRGAAAPVVVPESTMKMYERLIALLKFQRTKVIGSGESRKTLVCKRDFSFLQQFVCRVGGHITVLKCFEAALGELYFSAYLPQHCATVDLLVGTVDRLALIKDAEHGESELKEFEIAQLEDARPLLPYVVDRLRICPSVSMHCALYPQVKTTSIELNGYRRNAIHQGFKFKARVHGGAGKVMFRRVQSFLGVRFLLEGRLSSPTRLLVLKAYEPIARHTMRLKIPTFLRRVLFGHDDDDFSKWLPALLKKLRVHWRGDHELTLDSAVASIVVSVGQRRLVCCANAVDETRIELFLRDPATSDSCSCSLDEQQMNAFLALVPNTQAVGATVSSAAVAQIVHTMREEHDNKDDALLKRNKDHELYSIEAVITNGRKVRELLEKVSLYLIALDPKNIRAGFMTARCPVVIKFSWLASSDARSKQLATELRQREFLVKNRDLYERRVQMSVVRMEEELDALAFAKAKEADFLGEKVAQVSEDLASHLHALGDKAPSLIDEVTRAAADALLDNMHEKIIDRLRERESPGHSQEDVQKAREETLQAALVEAEQRERNVEEPEIMEGVWRVALEMGLKSSFREGKVRWQGHIAVKVLETNSWVGSEGIGKFYKFIVYEPSCAQRFEGSVRSKKHLIEVLGMNGKDLLDPSKEKEMLIFICRYRLEVVVNKYDALGEATAEDAPPYRIEFLSERLYSQDKVTPVNADADEDEEVNNSKLMEIDNARGRKIMRLVRRVSGILMQLTVFELPQAVADAALAGYIPTDPALLGIDISIPALAQAVARGENDNGFAEVRTILHNLKRYLPPAFRVVGYDPRSKRKVVLAVQPQAVLEVAGGVFSPYLDPERRKDLAKVICDAMMLYFPANQPFELTVPWSGAKQAVSTAEVARDKKVSSRSSADRVMQRKGRIFRSVLRISKYDLVVSVFVLEAEAAQLHTQGSRLIFNFYSPSVSEAAEVVVDESQQMERIGKLVTQCTEGTIRATCIRRLCRFFRAEIIEDILDPTHRTLNVVLVPADKAYVTEYQMVRVPPPGDDLRPVGIPSVFFPLDTCGSALHRRGMTLVNKDNDSMPRQKDFLITVYTKSDTETPERGLVLKLYDRAISQTSVLHLGPSELMRICIHADEPDLISDIVTAQIMQDQSKVDDLEEGFKEFTKKGELENKTKALVDIFVDIVLKDLGFFMSPQDTVVPYVRSSPKGALPS